MRNEPNEANDPIASWQSQPTETPVMTLEQIRAWGETIGIKNRREHRTQLLARVFCVVFASLWFSRSSNSNQRIAFALAIAWLLAGQYHAMFARRSRKLPADAGLSPTFAFLRQELQRKSDDIRLVWLRVLGPLFLIIGILAAPILAMAARNPVYLKNAAPFLVLLTVWLVAFYILRKRKRRELRRELQDLDALEREMGR